jgi:hypothetical protein
VYASTLWHFSGARGKIRRKTSRRKKLRCKLVVLTLSHIRYAHLRPISDSASSSVLLTVAEVLTLLRSFSPRRWRSGVAVQVFSAPSARLHSFRTYQITAKVEKKVRRKEEQKKDPSCFLRPHPPPPTHPPVPASSHRRSDRPAGCCRPFAVHHAAPFRRGCRRDESNRGRGFHRL